MRVQICHHQFNADSIGTIRGGCVGFHFSDDEGVACDVPIAKGWFWEVPSEDDGGGVDGISSHVQWSTSWNCGNRYTLKYSLQS